jgi:hypothetical protein
MRLANRLLDFPQALVLRVIQIDTCPLFLPKGGSHTGAS